MWFGGFKGNRLCGLAVVRHTVAGIIPINFSLTVTPSEKKIIVLLMNGNKCVEFTLLEHRQTMLNTSPDHFGIQTCEAFIYPSKLQKRKKRFNVTKLNQFVYTGKCVESRRY